MPSGTSHIYIIINYLQSNLARGGKATILKAAQKRGKLTLIGHQLFAEESGLKFPAEEPIR